MNPEEIDATNYYEYMKELEGAEREVKRLRKQLRFQESRKTLELIERMKLKVLENANAIHSACKSVKSNETKLVDKVVAQKEDFLRLDYAQHHNFKQLLENIRRIFASSDNVLESVDVDHAKIREFIMRMKLECNNIKIRHNNCLSLISNVEELIVNEGKVVSPKDVNIIGGSKIEVISSSKLRRKRSSILSESTFMNTFQSNNLSASSPIMLLKRTSSLTEGIENVKMPDLI